LSVFAQKVYLLQMLAENSTNYLNKYTTLIL